METHLQATVGQAPPSDFILPAGVTHSPPTEIILPAGVTHSPPMETNLPATIGRAPPSEFILSARVTLTADNGAHTSGAPGRVYGKGQRFKGAAIYLQDDSKIVFNRSKRKTK